jgi:hypothetical protein
MGSYYIEFTFELGGPDVVPGLETHLDEVAAAFAEIETVDGDVGADLETGRVDLCMTVPSDSRVDALSTAVIAARTAIHAAGGGTPGWDNFLTKLLDDDEYLVRSAPSEWSTRRRCPA